MRHTAASRSGKRAEVNPEAHLTHVLNKLPARPAGADLADLLPDGSMRSRVGARIEPR